MHNKRAPLLWRSCVTGLTGPVSGHWLKEEIRLWLISFYFKASGAGIHWRMTYDV